MFYKLIDGSLHYGSMVNTPDGISLHVDVTDLSTLPIDGWYYFATEEEAKSFFNISD